MPFTSFHLLLLATLVVGVNWMLGRLPGANDGPRIVWLILASLVFYGAFHPGYLLILACVSLGGFILGRAMEKIPTYRHFLLALSIAMHGGVLISGQSLGPWLDRLARVLALPGHSWVLHGAVSLAPIGLAYFTLQSFGFTMEAWRSRRAKLPFLDHMLAICFFPKLLAGPLLIPSSGDGEGDIETFRPKRSITSSEFLPGLCRIAWGAIEKLCIADTLAPLVDRVFCLHQPSALLVTAGTIAFAVQLFADFSGYTNMAIGTASLLGIRLPENLDRPFLASSPSDLLQRWHRTLGLWFRRYVYEPLAGSGGAMRSLLALWLTVGLATLWHGHHQSTLLCGAGIGALLTIELIFRRVGRFVPQGGRWWQVGAQLLITLAALRVLREPSAKRLFQFPRVPGRAEEWLSWSGWWPPDDRVIAWDLISLAALLGLVLIMVSLFRHSLWPRLRTTPWSLPLSTLQLATSIVLIWIFSRNGAHDFILVHLF